MKRGILVWLLASIAFVNVCNAASVAREEVYIPDLSKTLYKPDFDTGWLAIFGVEDQALSPREAWDTMVDMGLPEDRVTFFDIVACDASGYGDMIPAWNAFFVDEEGVPDEIFIDAVTGEELGGDEEGPMIETCNVDTSMVTYHIPLPSSEHYYSTIAPAKQNVRFDIQTFDHQYISQTLLSFFQNDRIEYWPLSLSLYSRRVLLDCCRGRRVAD